MASGPFGGLSPIKYLCKVNAALAFARQEKLRTPINCANEDTALSSTDTLLVSIR